MQRDFVHFIDYVPHIPEHKRKERERLNEQLDKECAPAIDIETGKKIYTKKFSYISRDQVKKRGMRKLSKRMGLLSNRAMNGELPGYKIIPEKVG